MKIRTYAVLFVAICITTVLGTTSIAVAADGSDLQAANRQFANPLTQATLWITENNTFVAGGDAVSGNRRSNVTIFDPLIPMSLGDSGWSL